MRKRRPVPPPKTALFTAKTGLIIRGQSVKPGEDFEARLDAVRDLLMSGQIEVSVHEPDLALIDLDDRIQSGIGTYLPKPRASAIRWTEAPAPCA